MESIIRQATPRSPQVEFDFANHRLSMEGESYPEDAAAFFGPLMEGLKKYLEDLGEQELVFDLKLAYFNSSSAKGLMNMFQMLEAAAERGCRIKICWHYHGDDDTMEEFGEDFAEDFEHADFQMCLIAED